MSARETATSDYKLVRNAAFDEVLADPDGDAAHDGSVDSDLDLDVASVDPRQHGPQLLLLRLLQAGPTDDRLTHLSRDGIRYCSQALL